MNALPKPSTLEQKHSEKLVAVIKQQIEEAGGKISFGTFMQACLYTPGLGYYSAGATKFGAAGDFVTAPEISELFGQSLAEYYLQFKSKNFPETPLNIIELGAGTGKLAGDILTYLQMHNNLPEYYYILEVSADLKQKQQNYLAEKCPEFFSNIIWLNALDNLPNFNGNGLILANEVLDALPVELFKLTPKAPNDLEIAQIWVTLHPNDPNRFETISLPADLEFKTSVKSVLDLEDFSFDASHYLSEINLHVFPWLAGIEKMIDKGQLIFIDYGFGAPEYYHLSRHMGTLLCHYKHHAHGDFLSHIGLQDITAHVNFTQVALAAKQLGLTIDNFTTQAEFLLSQNLGLLTEKQLATASPAERIKLINQLQLLTAPHEMGELCKVLILQKGELDPIHSGRPHFHRL